MADYREISQEYARGGIKAALLVNAGAAVALLSQVAELAKPSVAGNVRWALVVWAIGVFVAAMVWLLAFMSARYVDKSERETRYKEKHIKTSNLFMFIGVLGIIISLLCFSIGSIILAWGLGEL